MKRLVILISGRGSNMAAILDAEHAGAIAGHVVSVISNRADAAGLDVASARGIPTTVVDERHYHDRGPITFEQALVAAIDALSPDLVPAREELADAYGALGRGPDQLEQLQVLALLDRSRVERQVAVSLAQARAGHGELAVLTLGSALERTSDQSRIYSALGRVWLDMADTRGDALSKALEALERVALTADASSEVMTLYGRALVKANKLEAAEQALVEAGVMAP